MLYWFGILWEWVDWLWTPNMPTGGGNRTGHTADPKGSPLLMEQEMMASHNGHPIMSTIHDGVVSLDRNDDDDGIPYNGDNKATTSNVVCFTTTRNNNNNHDGTMATEDAHHSSNGDRILTVIPYAAKHVATATAPAAPIKSTANDNTSMLRSSPFIHSLVASLWYPSWQKKSSNSSSGHDADRCHLDDHLLVQEVMSDMEQQMIREPEPSVVEIRYETCHDSDIQRGTRYERHRQGIEVSSLPHAE